MNTPKPKLTASQKVMMYGTPDKNGVITPIDFRENTKAPSEFIQFKGKVYLINLDDDKYFPSDHPDD